MNIFVSDTDPIIAAINLDDKRLVKMILETTQLISAAIILNGGTAPYKLTHAKHPATIWAANNKANTTWLLTHGFAMCYEYMIRFHKVHKCFSFLIECQKQFDCIPDGTLQPFPNCTTNKAKGISFKHIENTVEAYKLYLNARWKTDTRKPKWTNSKAPSFYEA